MGFRTTIVLLLIFLALGSYYVFVERERPTERELERQEKTVLQFDRMAMESLEIQREGERIRCVKTDEGWEMTSPVGAKCDETAVASVLASLSSLQATRFLSPDTTALGQFGLEDPRIRLSVASSSPPDSHWLFIGDEIPTGDGYYSFADTRDRIALIPSSTVDSHYRKTSFDLRDKTVLDFEVAHARALEIEYDDVKFRCERAPQRPWRLTEPTDAQGDDTEINSILWDLENAKVREFLNEPAEDLAPYGLEDPEVTVKVFVGASNRLKRLDMGAEADGGGVIFARRTGREDIVKIDKRLLDKVKVDPIDLRQKRLLDFSTSDVASITISTSDTTFSAVRDTTEEWATPPPRQVPLKKWKMNGVSSQLSFLRAVSFVDDPDPDLAAMGLADPRVNIEVTLNDTSLVVLEVGAVEGNEVFVRAPDQIAKVSEGFLDDLMDLVKNPPYIEEETANDQPE